MGRDRTHQATPDLFSTDMVRDASPPPTRRVSATEAAMDTASKRHVLPNDLPNAVKYLTDRELDLLITASVQEAKRRGRLSPRVQPNPTDEPVAKQSSSRHKGQTEVAGVIFNNQYLPPFRLNSAHNHPLKSYHQALAAGLPIHKVCARMWTGLLLRRADAMACRRVAYYVWCLAGRVAVNLNGRNRPVASR